MSELKTCPCNPLQPHRCNQDEIVRLREQVEGLKKAGMSDKPTFVHAHVHCQTCVEMADEIARLRALEEPR